MIHEIEVTEQFINMGSRQSCQYCPVALAIADKLKLDNLKILVSPNSVGFYPKNARDVNSRYGNANLPNQVYSWIVKFDMDYRVCNPFKFTLEIPPRLWEVINKANRLNTR